MIGVAVAATSHLFSFLSFILQPKEVHSGQKTYFFMASEEFIIQYKNCFQLLMC